MVNLKSLQHFPYNSCNIYECSWQPNINVTCYKNSTDTFCLVWIKALIEQGHQNIGVILIKLKELWPRQSGGNEMNLYVFKNSCACVTTLHPLTRWRTQLAVWANCWLHGSKAPILPASQMSNSPSIYWSNILSVQPTNAQSSIYSLFSHRSIHPSIQ